MKKLERKKEMKITYVFDTSDQDDVSEHNIHKQSKDMYMALWDIKTMMRTLIKYGSISNCDVSSMTKEEVIDKLFEAFHDIIQEYNLDLE